MKKIFLVMMAALLLFSSCGKQPGEGLMLLHKGTTDLSQLSAVWREETGFDLPPDTAIEVLFDDFDTTDYTGSSLCIVNLKDSKYADTVGAQIEQLKNWHKNPIDETLKQYLTQAAQKAQIEAPSFENGCYMGKFICWIDNAEKIVYTPDTPENIEVITVVYWDEDSKIMYYYCCVPDTI